MTTYNGLLMMMQISVDMSFVYSQRRSSWGAYVYKSEMRLLFMRHIADIYMKFWIGLEVEKYSAL